MDEKSTRTKTKVKVKQDGTIGWIYFLTIIGAIIYYFGQAHSFGGYLWAIIKGFVWPAALLYKIMTILHI